MELSEIIPHIEVLIFASEKPLTSPDIVELINNAFGFMEQRITLEQVESCMENIADKYESEFFPFEVRESGGGWQFLTKKIFHKTVAQLNGDKFLKRLSNAAMETLAIIAYKQPITKGEIEGIRGVNSDYSIQKLLEKELIIISGRNENMPGKPLIYSTSKSFMDYFGINSAEDLPKIKEVLAEQMVEATIVNGAHVSEEDVKHEEEEAVVIQSEIPLAVDSNGALIPQEEETLSDTEDGASGETTEDTPEASADTEQTETTEDNTEAAEEESDLTEPSETADSGSEAGEENTTYDSNDDNSDNNEDGHQEDDEESGEQPEQQ